MLNIEHGTSYVECGMWNVEFPLPFQREGLGEGLSAGRVLPLSNPSTLRPLPEPRADPLVELFPSALHRAWEPCPLPSCLRSKRPSAKGRGIRVGLLATRPMNNFVFHFPRPPARLCEKMHEFLRRPVDTFCIDGLHCPAYGRSSIGRNGSVVRLVVLSC